MPDFDLLMEEWAPRLQDALARVEFPGPEIALNTIDYARLIAMMLDIPVHKGDKGVIEALHVVFSLYSDFKESDHFKQMNNNNTGGAGQGVDMIQI